MPRKFRQIIRIAGTNVDGTKKLAYALTEIKGVGIRLANVIVEKAGLDQDTRLGFLSDDGVKGIESIIENPSKNDIPKWFLNRKKDRETGNDLHLIGPDIDLQVKSDIERMKKNQILERIPSQSWVEGEGTEHENHRQNPKVPRS